jgi:uncharacterized protein (TIGR02246 family)
MKKNHMKNNDQEMTMNETATSPTHLMELFARRAGCGDLDGLLELYETDAVFQPQPGVRLVGTDRIRAALSEFLGLNPQIVFAGETDVVTVGEVALVANDWTMSGVAPDGSAVADGGRSADVVRRQDDGRWLVVIDQPRGEPGPQ